MCEALIRVRDITVGCEAASYTAASQEPLADTFAPPAVTNKGPGRERGSLHRNPFVFFSFFRDCIFLQRVMATSTYVYHVNKAQRDRVWCWYRSLQNAKFEWNIKLWLSCFLKFLFLLEPFMRKFQEIRGFETLAVEGWGCWKRWNKQLSLPWLRNAYLSAQGTSTTTPSL